MNLRIPGPTSLPPSVLAAASCQMIGHRTPDFAALFNEIQSGLRAVFQTQNEVLVFAGSGTGGLEATVVNLLSPGDRVLVPHCGAFGKRWAIIAETFGASVAELEFPAGRPVDPGPVMSHLRKEHDISLVLITHNETSTGVTNDVASLSDALLGLGRDRPLLAVDAISSLGGIDLPVDKLGLDVVVAASQKALMTPPGLVFVALTPRAWDVVASSQCPRYYWNFRTAWAWNQQGGTPFTPAISLLYALQAALRLIRAEGLAAVFERHRRLAQKLRDGLRRLGLLLFVDEPFASNTVTAVLVPTGWEANEFVQLLGEEYGITVAGGTGSPIFRIGHMGYVSDEDIDQVLMALEDLLDQPSRKATRQAR